MSEQDGVSGDDNLKAAPYKRILYSAAVVNKRIEEMAAQIVVEYKGLEPLFVCLLNGAQPFAFKLMLAIQNRDQWFRPNLQSMIVSRYGDARQAAEPHLVTDLPPEYRQLSGRHVILLDDLVDKGGTLAFTRDHLFNYGAKSVDCIVLIKKKTTLTHQLDLKMYGFEAPDVWLTGMGMDDQELGEEANRWAEWIAIAR